MKVLEYIQSESDRQSATLDETINMVRAWGYVRSMDQVPNLESIAYINEIIRNGPWPSLSWEDNYRKVPAVFNQGSPAPHASLIPDLMRTWHKAFAAWILGPEKDRDVVIREFLAIHPFVDGNGRVASLLYNWGRGSMDDPIPLPYYFGEQ